MLNQIMDFMFNNIFYFIIAGFGIWFLLKYLKFGSRTKVKVISRGEIERLKFIERMKFNESETFKDFVVGDRLRGRITHFRQFTVGNPTKQFTQMLVKPMLIRKLNIVNPVAKHKCVQIDSKLVTLDEKTKAVKIVDGVFFDFLFGIYYDTVDEKQHLENIKSDNVLRTDYDQMAGRYWVKGQQQCVYSPEMALQLALKERELAIELAKKKGKAETV